MRAAAAVALALVLAAGCGGDDAPPPPPGTPTTAAEVGTIAARLDDLLASPAPTGEGRSTVLAACIELHRAAEYAASDQRGAGALRERLGADGRTAIADAARDCTLDPAAARAAVERLRAALR
ncbi:MAG TPA: hypothetical protein VGX28_04510 [Frankiaceae bacterium]|nr:hypothetical protein [Frankiaceae bacterium]